MKILDNIYILFSDIADFSTIRDDYKLAEKLIDHSDIIDDLPLDWFENESLSLFTDDTLRCVKAKTRSD